MVNWVGLGNEATVCILSFQNHQGLQITFLSSSSRCHTLALIDSTGKLYSFGLGANGQLGTSATTNQKTPTPVHGGWLPSTSLQEEGDLIDFGTPVDLVPLAEHGFVVKRVFAGGDQSFVSVIVNKMGAKVHAQLPSCLSFFLPSGPLHFPTSPPQNPYPLPPFLLSSSHSPFLSSPSPPHLPSSPPFFLLFSPLPSLPLNLLSLHCTVTIYMYHTTHFD